MAVRAPGVSVTHTTCGNFLGQGFIMDHFDADGEHAQIRTLFCRITVSTAAPNENIKKGSPVVDTLGKCKNLTSVVFHGRTDAITQKALDQIIQSLPALDSLEVVQPEEDLRIADSYLDLMARRRKEAPKTKNTIIRDLVHDFLASLPSVVVDIIGEYASPLRLRDLVESAEDPDPLTMRVHSRCLDLLRPFESHMREDPKISSWDLIKGQLPEAGEKAVTSCIGDILEHVSGEFQELLFDPKKGHDGLRRIPLIHEWGLDRSEIDQITFASRDDEIAKKVETAAKKWVEARSVDEFVDVVKHRDYHWLFYRFTMHLLSSPDFQAKA